MATSPITTPAQAQQILDLSNAQFNNIRNYFGVNDYPFQPERTYIIFDAASGNNTLHIDTGSSTSYYILKGDGTLPTSYTDTGGNKTLNYAVAGRYLITIDGDFNGIDTTGASDADKAKYISIVGGTNYPIAIIDYAFYSCINLEYFYFQNGTTFGFKSFFGCPVLYIKNNYEYMFSRSTVLLNIPGLNLPSLAALNSTDFALIDDGIGELRTYRYNGHSITLVGSALSIASMSFPKITALNSTDIAMCDRGNDRIRTYRFNGSTWSMVGSEYTFIVGAGNTVGLTALNSTDIAIHSSGLNSLNLFRFNGSTWTRIGYNVLVASGSQMTALNSTDIAFLKSNAIQAYRFNGATWDVLGSQLSIGTASLPSISSFDKNTICMYDDNSYALKSYRFDGVNWRQCDNAYITTAINSSMAIIGNKIIFVDGVSEDIRIFFRIGVS